MKPETINRKPVDFEAIQLERIRAYNEAQFDSYEDRCCRTDRMVAVVILAAAACSLIGIMIVISLILFR